VPNGTTRPADPTVELSADGELTIDLRDGATPATAPESGTDPAAVCPNCAGPVRVDHADAVGRHTHFACTHCGFTFSRRTA
jgi:hypothetical protein